MKKILRTIGICLLMAALSSCSGGNNPSGPGSGSNSTSGDIFGVFYFVNPLGVTATGTATLDGGSPVTLTFTQGTDSEADPRLFRNVPDGSHTVAYSDAYGGSLTCTVNLAKGYSATAFTVTYNFNSPVLTSKGSCGFSTFH